MNYFRQLHKQYLFVCIIALGMLVRTFVAPGFMLNTKTTNGDLFAVTLCHGPNNINQLPGLEKPNKHNEPASNDHKKQTNCNLWTSSSTSLVIDQFILDYKNQFLDGELILYKASFDTSFIRTSQYARAPPALI
jgi:hypothetical protein